MELDETTSLGTNQQQREEYMKRLWMAFVAVMVLSFLVLGRIGTRIYSETPPLPQQVVATDGELRPTTTRSKALE